MKVLVLVFWVRITGTDAAQINLNVFFMLYLILRILIYNGLDHTHEILQTSLVCKIIIILKHFARTQSSVKGIFGFEPRSDR